MEKTALQKNWKAKIIDKKTVAENTFEVSFEIIEKDFTFKAGQYVWVVLPELRYDDPKGDRRAFSVCTTPTLKNRISIIFRNSNSGYKKTLLELDIGAEVQVIGPFGYMDFPQDEKTPVVFLAGGVGIAPFLSLIRNAIEKKDTRKITLLYANSNIEKAAYSEELSKIGSENTNIIIKQITGSIDWDFISESVTSFENVIWYVIGTEKMVTGTAKMLYQHSVNEENIKFEEFYVSKESITSQIKLPEVNIENVFTLALEESFNHVILTDLNGKIIFANRGAEIITGFLRSEMIGQTPRLWGGLMEKSFYDQLWQTIKRDKKPFQGKVRNRRRNGEVYYTISRISPILNKDKELIGYVGAEEDITQQVVYQKQIEQENAKGEAIFSSIGEGLIVTDAMGNILLVNHAFEVLLGWNSAEIVGKKMLEVIPKYDEDGGLVPNEERSLTAVLSGRISRSSISTVEKPYYYLCHDKSKLAIVGVATPIVLDDKVVGAVQIFRDISEAVEIFKIKDEFLSIAAHDLRTPSAAIRGFLSRVLDGDAGEISEKARDLLQSAYDGNLRLIKLVDDFLVMSRIERGKIIVEPVVGSLESAVEKVVKENSEIAKGKNLYLDYKKVDLPNVLIDEEKIIELLNNLIANAIKFTEKGGITITHEITDKEVITKVADTGIGISKEAQGRLFQKYQKVNLKESIQSGLGLGLYICRLIIEKHNGRIWVESEEGKGSTFSFSLPHVS